MTDREAQIEALWTYEISTEKISGCFLFSSNFSHGGIRIDPHIRSAHFFPERRWAKSGNFFGSCVRNADKPWQGRRDNSASRDCGNVPGVAVSRVYVGIGPVVSNVSA